tara:strand:+ start:5825 stop:6076 length:252 start_codon:yes stop_codon:yes gene_type:complete
MILYLKLPYYINYLIIYIECPSNPTLSLSKLLPIKNLKALTCINLLFFGFNISENKNIVFSLKNSLLFNNLNKLIFNSTYAYL